jgi:hypothetical protein
LDVKFLTNAIIEFLKSVPAVCGLLVVYETKEKRFFFKKKRKHYNIVRFSAPKPKRTEETTDVLSTLLLRKIQSFKTKRIVCRFNQAERYRYFCCCCFLEITKFEIHLMDILGSFWPHMAYIRVLGTVEQTLEILK